MLSWPREGDTRRSMVSREIRRGRMASQEYGFSSHFLNIGSSDMELYLILSSNALNSYKERRFTPEVPLLTATLPGSIPRPLSWKASGQGEFENDLLSYYDQVLSAILTSVGDKRFRGLLIGMSFIDSSPASVAVQQSLYALIAHYVYGHIRSMRFKVNAISALMHSIQSCVNAKDGLQQVVAGILLSLYEMLDFSESTCHWQIYAGGAKHIAKRIYTLDRVYEGDALTVLNLMFYHDALNKFTARHWKQRTADMLGCARDDCIIKAVLQSGNTSKIRNTIGCSAEVLEVIAKICDNILDHNDPARGSLEYIEHLNHLERRLTHVKQLVDQEDEIETLGQPCQDDSVPKIAELYRLAGLIYLNRAGKGFPSNKSNVRLLVEAGLEIVASLDACGRAFPVVILGCEARSDSDRLVILDLLRRTKSCRKIGFIAGAQKFIETWWAQDDLHAEEEFDYVRKFDAIMSLSKYRPSFAVSLMGGSFLPTTHKVKSHDAE